MNDSKHIDPLSEPLENNSLVFLVLERIKEALLNRDLKPGDCLPSESELSRNLGVGKSSIREAIRMLQAMGVVTVRRGQRSIVRKRPGDDFINSMIFQLILEDGNLKNVVDLRMMFETAYTRMAMEEVTEEDIKEIEETIYRMQESIQCGCPNAEDDLAFHMAILRSTHNPLVVLVGETVMQLFKTSIGTSMRSVPETALHNHKQIFKAFCEKNEEKLRNAIVKSFEGWKIPENPLSKKGA